MARDKKAYPTRPLINSRRLAGSGVLVVPAVPTVTDAEASTISPSLIKSVFGSNKVELGSTRNKSKNITMLPAMVPVDAELMRKLPVPVCIALLNVSVAGAGPATINCDCVKSV